MSPLLPSAMVIVPKVVHAPVPPLAAVSAEIADPPDAGVIVTDARSRKVGKISSPSKRTETLVIMQQN
jgi:hypothetical protein